MICAALAAMELAELGAESEGSLHETRFESLRIDIPIADREIRNHNDGMIPTEAALALEKMRAFASAAFPRT